MLHTPLCWKMDDAIRFVQIQQLFIFNQTNKSARNISNTKHFVPKGFNWCKKNLDIFGENLKYRMGIVDH